MSVDPATTAAVNTAGRVFSAFGRKRRERRQELDRHFNDFVAVTSQIAVTYAQAFHPERPATTGVGRALTRLSTFLSEALFSSREVDAFRDLLRPDVAQRNEELRNRLVDSSVRLARIAPQPLVDAMQRLVEAMAKWEQSAEPESEEWQVALTTFTPRSSG